jgi:hypothetical protein
VPVSQVPEVPPKDRGLRADGLLAGFEAAKLVASFALRDDGLHRHFDLRHRGGLAKRSALGDYAVRKARFARTT